MFASFRQPVFIAAFAIVSVLVIAGASAPETFGAATSAALDWVTTHFGWFYLASVFGFVVVLVYLGFSKYGETRIGKPDSEPEFSYYAWISMLLAAGFGIGLVFYGVAEPMSHFIEPPYGLAEPATPEAARLAIQYAMFNWGISQWAGFSIVGLIMGIYQFRKDKPGLVSAVLEPALRRAPARRGIAGSLDTYAVVATVMGIATSLGLGVLQINGGLSSVFGIPEGFWSQALILVVIFVAYMISAATGLDKGIRILSSINLALALALMMYVLVFGPTVVILRTIVQGIGDYLQNFLAMSLRAGPYQGAEWAGQWTIFYWAWTIAWSPFVGTFVARISQGRTIREYVLGVLVMPPLIACIWMGVFGAAGLHADLTADAGLGLAVQDNITTALFQLLELLPLSFLLSVMAVTLIFIFLVTSADSASYILAQLTDRGSMNPPLAKRMAWGGLMAAICLTLIATGGLEGLQAGAILAALPFTLILYAMVWSLLRELAIDRQLTLRQLYREHGETPVAATIEEARSLDQ